MRAPDDLVRVEVHYCVSTLVSELARGYGGTNEELGDLAEQAFELASPIEDWEEAAFEAGFSRVGDMWHSATKDATYGSAEDACNDWDMEPYQREVYEHWIVSDWLADRLAEKGEKVDKDFVGLTVWARTTTGQGIASDSVIEAIAADLNKD
jgi:hypothetical protein